MLNFFNNLKSFTAALFNVLSLYFDLFFNRLTVFNIGVAWWFIILGLIGYFGSLILGVLDND